MLRQSIAHMSKAKHQVVHKRGFARNLYGRPASQQERALLDDGCHTVYVDGRGLETWKTFAQSLRKGDVAVIERAGALPHGTTGIRDALRDLDGIGAVLLVASTGQRSDTHRADIILDAVEQQKQNKHTWSKRDAKAAAQKSWKNRKKERAPDDEVRAMWYDTRKYPNTQELVAILAKRGWSARLLYKRFRGRWPELCMGRPPKKRFVRSDD